MKTIKVFGGVEGQYYPENLMKGKEGEFALAGFVWRDNKPLLRLSDFKVVSSAVKSKEVARTTPVIMKKVTKKK